uniref:Pentapeptide repeat protein n=1 Tax=mine drainage metagenome TaxID=410659 RepID=E6QT41_9ZZZZ
MDETVSEVEVLKKGNREVITDFYINTDVSSEPQRLAFKVFIRLNAKKVTFKNISFLHCVFDGCYFNTCVFDSCDFTGCRFISSNFHQSSFAGCKFEFATFERSQLDDDILVSEAPKEENLRMHFARSLRMNYQQIGNAKAVNKAISIELEATSSYLYKSWRSGETYYRKKYPGLINNIAQFLKWSAFWILDFIWGNGESIPKLLRSILLSVIMIAVYDTNVQGNLLNVGFYWSSFQISPAIFLGVLSPHSYTLAALSIITGTRFISIALLTALLVKRFSRR